MSAPAETVVVRDDSGRECRAAVGSHGTVTVDGVVLTLHAAADGSIAVTGPRRMLLWAVDSGETRWVFVDGRVFTFERDRRARVPRRTAAHHGSLTAPMPATVRQVAVSTGATVRRGDVLIVLEAMKMELPVRATADGRVAAVHCREGELVQPGVALLEIEESA